jgi:peroxiredoxin
VIKPRTPAPALDVELVSGGRWRLADQEPDRLTMIVFYRGLHCPVCKGYLRQLDRMLDDFAAVGVTSVVAMSGDSAERARESVQEWGLGRLAVGYGQTIESMREWGLFVSKAIKDDEPDEFGEPGLFLIRRDRTVFAEILNSMPFGRPRFEDLVVSLKWIAENDYPARGEA